MLELVIGNKNYSSWSMRPWVLMKECGIPFRESRIWLDTPTAAREKAAHTPAGRVPVLHDGGLTVWDSLAIVEYLAERHPDRGVWPPGRRARARARSLCAEMHAGFIALRERLPLNCRARGKRLARDAAVQADLRRIFRIWTDTPREFGGGGPHLFGRFSAADAFFAPVASRFLTYGVEPPPAAAAYARALQELPAFQDWLDGASGEELALQAVDRLP